MKFVMFADVARRKENATFIDVGIMIILTAVAICVLAMIGVVLAAAFYGFLFFLLAKLSFDSLKEIRWKRLFRTWWAKVRGKKPVHEDTYPNTTEHIAIKVLGKDAGCSDEEACASTHFDTSVSPMKLLKQE